MRRLAWLLSLATVSLAPSAPRTMTPEQHLGFRIGSDRQLADWQQMLAYFKKLDAASDRVLVQELGRTTLDRPFIVVMISDPQTLRRLETYREIQQLLSDPRRSSDRVSELMARGKTVVLNTCSIHSSEIGASQMSLEAAYDLATGKDAETLEILRNVILLLVPSLNPDGHDIVTRWYRETLGTPAEGTSVPELYHAYAGHDNNRDWYMVTQRETRLAVEKIHNVWHPHIVFDMHQMGPYGPRIFLPPYIDPIDQNVDPILQAEIVELGGALFSGLLGAGKTGVVIGALFDAYAPSRAYQHYHGGVRILSEVASARLASPVSVAAQRLAGSSGDFRRAAWNAPAPWPGGEWRLRDIVDYEKVTLKACLLHASRHRERWLRNFYQVGRNGVDRKRPYAFVVPSDQPDLQGLQDLLRVLHTGLVEIWQATEPFEVSPAGWVSPPFGSSDRRRFPAGSYIVRMNQPYSSFAGTLLEIQRYPELREYPGGPLRRPYDVTAQTLGIQLGVAVYRIDDAFQVRSRRVSGDEIDAAGVRFDGVGEYWLYSHGDNAFAKLTNRVLKRGAQVSWAPNGFQVEGKGFPAGTMLARVRGNDSEWGALTRDLPALVSRVGTAPELAWQRIRAPRIGVYKSHMAVEDEGWTRWVLETYEFPYERISDADIRAGKLSGLDVLIFPDQHPAGIREGLKEPYPEPYRGGLGTDGIARVKQFVESGGAVLLLGGATRLARTDLGVGVTDRTEGLSRREFYVPGSLLRVSVNSRHPIGYGVPEDAAVMFLNNPVFELSHGLSIVQYAPRDVLLSGWIDGERHLVGKCALAEVRMGRGCIILIGFRTQFRAQMRSTYKFLFNSLYYATTWR